MDVKYVETRRVKLQEENPKYVDSPFHDNGKIIKDRVHKFNWKVEGKRHLNGEYTNDWVQYLN